jgi:hypothetical protein
MAQSGSTFFPLDFEENFERGDKGLFNTLTGTAIDYPHYTTLAQFGLAPYRGAYCMRQIFDGAAGSADLDETDSSTLAAAKRAHIQFWLKFHTDMANTATDTIPILELQDVGNNVLICMGFKITQTTNAIQLGIGKAAPTAFGNAISTGKWYLVEVDALLDSGGNDGTIDLYVAEEGDPFTTTVAHATGLTGLTQAAITHMHVGAQDVANATTGTMLLDQFKFLGVDNTLTRVTQDIRRWEQTTRLTRSGHVFVGPGVIDNVTLIAEQAEGGTVEARIWDTDVARIGGFNMPIIELHTTAQGEFVDPANMPQTFNRGCYVELVEETTDLQYVNVQMRSAVGWGSEGAVITHAGRRGGV